MRESGTFVHSQNPTSKTVFRDHPMPPLLTEIPNIEQAGMVATRDSLVVWRNQVINWQHGCPECGSLFLKLPLENSRKIGFLGPSCLADNVRAAIDEKSEKRPRQMAADHKRFRVKQEVKIVHHLSEIKSSGIEPIQKHLIALMKQLEELR